MNLWNKPLSILSALKAAKKGGHRLQGGRNIQRVGISSMDGAGKHNNKASRKVLCGRQVYDAPRFCRAASNVHNLRRMSVWLLFMAFLAHIVLLAIFTMVDVKPMMVLNVCGLLIYSILIALLTSSRMPLCVANAVSLIEIMVHAASAVVFIGWDSGFCMYCIALVSVVFFLSRAAENYNRRLHHPLLLSISISIFYFLLRFYALKKKPLYVIPVFWTKFFYLTNSAITFVAVICFAKIYSDAIESIERAYRRESNIDELTLLYNRRKARDILGDVHEAAMDSGVPYMVAMMDVDDFKQINDTYGHNAGDYALLSVSHKILCHISDNTKACRWGGDEFLLIGTPSKDEASSILELLRQDVERTEFRHDGVSFRLTVTIGVASYNENSTISEVIGRADAALYRAKNAGKNRVFW